MTCTSAHEATQAARFGVAGQKQQGEGVSAQSAAGVAGLFIDETLHALTQMDLHYRPLLVKRPLLPLGDLQWRVLPAPVDLGGLANITVSSPRIPI